MDAMIFRRTVSVYIEVREQGTKTGRVLVEGDTNPG